MAAGLQDLFVEEDISVCTHFCRGRREGWENRLKYTKRSWQPDSPASLRVLHTWQVKKKKKRPRVAEPQTGQAEAPELCPPCADLPFWTDATPQFWLRCLRVSSIATGAGTAHHPHCRTLLGAEQCLSLYHTLDTCSIPWAVTTKNGPRHFQTSAGGLSQRTTGLN